MRFTVKAILALFLLGSGCAPVDAGSEDPSWVGGVIGVILGFGLFFLAVYMSSRSSR